MEFSQGRGGIDGFNTSADGRTTRQLCRPTPPLPPKPRKKKRSAGRCRETTNMIRWSDRGETRERESRETGAPVRVRMRIWMRFSKDSTPRLAQDYNHPSLCTIYPAPRNLRWRPWRSCSPSPRREKTILINHALIAPPGNNNYEDNARTCWSGRQPCSGFARGNSEAGRRRHPKTIVETACSGGSS